MNVETMRDMGAIGARRPGHVSMHQSAEFVERATDLRLRGLTYERIARQLDCSIEGARQAVLRGMERIRSNTEEMATELRHQETARLDRISETLTGIAERATDESTALAVVDRLLRVQERRARLLGLDLQRLEVTGANGGPIQIAQIQRVIVDAPTTLTATVLDGHALPAPSGDAVPRDADATLLARREHDEESAT